MESTYDLGPCRLGGQAARLDASIGWAACTKLQRAQPGAGLQCRTAAPRLRRHQSSPKLQRYSAYELRKNTMAILRTFQKQPAETLDYSINFARWLTELSDTGASMVATVDAGITLGATSFVNGVAKARLNGGTSGTSYKLTFTVTTTGGLIKEDELMIDVLAV